MRALILDAQRSPLVLRDIATPAPGPGELLVRVRACAICRTDLHVVDGELARPKLPLVLGHEAVGIVERAGEPGLAPWLGRRVGVPWLAWTCGACEHCRAGRDNLCSRALFHGYTKDGGYAEAMLVDARFAVPLPETMDDAHAAPLLCAGLIGHRALSLAGDAARVGLYGFGAAAHIITQVLRHQGREVFAFVRPGDEAARTFALRLGASWAGDAANQPPVSLDAAIIFAPAGELVVRALAAVRPGGTVVCAGIHMSDIPSFPYSLLWGERVLRSVANLRQSDGEAFFRAIEHVPLATEVTVLPLEQANAGLGRLRAGEVSGALVLAIA